jgi:hypothetical protein
VNIWGKLKPNVLIVTLIVGALIFVFGLWLVPELAKQVSNEILALLIGVGIGGLLGIAGALASDGPPDHLGKALELLISRDSGRHDESPEEKAHYAAEAEKERQNRIEIARIAAGQAAD